MPETGISQATDLNRKRRLLAEIHQVEQIADVTTHACISRWRGKLADV
jgi:hypothetical protein